jgi:hypothetical protein
VPLIFRPGFLTAEFIAGHRARYVPPFRLYLIISFAMFLLLSLSANDTLKISFDGEDLGDEVALADPNAPGAPLVIDTRPLPQTREDDETAIVFAPVHIGREADSTGAEGEDAPEIARDFDLSLDPNDPDLPPWLAVMGRRLERNVERLKEDPSLFLDRLLEYLPQIMFLMLPLFALLLLVCYALSPFHYLQHLVFGLHYHSFVYLLYLLAGLLEPTGVNADPVLVLMLLAYLPLALRGAYGSSVAGALAKSLFIYLTYLVLLILGLAVVSVLVVAML